MTKAKSHSTCDPRVFNSEQAIDTNGRQACNFLKQQSQGTLGYQAETRFQALVKSCQVPPPSGSIVTSNLSLLPPVGKEIQPNALWMPSPPTVGYNIDWCISLNSAVNKVDFQL